MALRAVPDHPKFADLKARLKCSKYRALGCLESIWHFAGKYTPQGNIGKYPDTAIEAWVEWDGEPGALIAALQGAGWLDADPTHRLLVHDWAQHADKATKLSLQRQRQTFCALTVRTLYEHCGDGSTETGTVYGLPVPVPVPEPVPVPVPVPEAKTKAAQKKSAAFVLPAWISIEVWKDFEEMRRKKRAPLTDRARKNIVAALVKLEAQGQQAEAVLNQSITNCWSGVFPLSEQFSKNRRGDVPVLASPRLQTQAELDAEEQKQWDTWRSMSAAYRAANPWRGRVFEEVA